MKQLKAYPQPYPQFLWVSFLLINKRFTSLDQNINRTYHRFYAI